MEAVLIAMNRLTISKGGICRCNCCNCHPLLIEEFITLLSLWRQGFLLL